MSLIFISFALVACQEIEHAVVYGNTAHLGYYYVNLWVGTPPVKQTVIIDTGSRLTAFPCTGCTDCGRHMDSYFDFEKSNTSHVIGCDENIPCSSCKNSECGYSQSYAEGSSISGILVEDYIMFGDDYLHSERVKFVFGCHTRETNLFRTQLADGIMGLAFEKNRIPTLVDVLYKEKDISTDVFALCFGLYDGYMTIGGYNSSLHLSEVKWTDLYDETFYSIDWKDLIIGGIKLNLPSHYFSSHYTTGTIVDSGTTFAYLSNAIYDNLFNNLDRFCDKADNCDGEKINVNNEPKTCYRYNNQKYPDLYDFFETFPILTLEIGDIQVDWKPEYYLFSWMETPNDFCLGIYAAGSGANVLGGIFSRGMDVIFDRSINKIGFAEAECDPKHIHSSEKPIVDHNVSSPKNNLIDRSAHSQINYYILVIGLSVGLVFLSIVGYLSFILVRKYKRLPILSSEEVSEDENQI